MQNDDFQIITRVSYKDAHYGGGIVAGAMLLELFGDAVTGLSAINDYDESLLKEWHEVKFFEKVVPGDFVKVNASLVGKKKLRRTVLVNAYKIIKSVNPGASDLMPGDENNPIASALGTIVIPVTKAKLRKANEPV